MAFARYYILKYMSPREGYDAILKPTVDDMGLQWFITFAGSLVLIHHFFFFYLEVFRFSEFFRTFLRSILSSIGTFLFIYLIQFLFFTITYRNINWQSFFFIGKTTFIKNVTLTCLSCKKHAKE